jgi:hypothetical protein
VRVAEAFVGEVVVFTELSFCAIVMLELGAIINWFRRFFFRSIAFMA